MQTASSGRSASADAEENGKGTSPSGGMKRANLVKVVDLYGFQLEVSRAEATVLSHVTERVKEAGMVWWAVEANKGSDWYLQPDMISGPPRGLVSQLSGSLSTLAGSAGQLQKLVRKGIPPALRPQVWRAVSGVMKKRSTVPDGYYQDLIEAVHGRETAATRQIDHDLGRTFPGHRVIDSPEGQATLRRILTGYSFRDSRVGYCQGMNFVAASLLLVMKNEEDAFWMLAVLLENILLHDSYSENLYGCHVEQRVFKDLFRKKCPRLATHLDEIDFDVSLIATEWFLCLFSKSLPSESTMRVWDVLFNEGANILFRVALAFFMIKEEDLLRAKHVGDAIKILQEVGHKAYDPEEFLKVAFEKVGTISTKSITKQRKVEQPAVQAELDRQINRLNYVKESRASPGK